MREAGLTILRRIRHALGSVRRWALTPWQQSSIGLSDASNIFGCRFGSAGWHHLVATLREYQADPSVSWRQTTLSAYHHGFQPRNVFELVGRDVDFPLFEFPWGAFNLGLTGKSVERSRFCGPSPDQLVEAEYISLVHLFDDIRTHGYRPWRYGNGFILGSWLCAADGRRRFVVLQGNHRMACLTALGVTRVAVRTAPSLLQVRIYEHQVEQWPHVRSGRISRDDALAVFRMFFEQNGMHVARRAAPSGTSR